MKTFKERQLCQNLLEDSGLPPVESSQVISGQRQGIGTSYIERRSLSQNIFSILFSLTILASAVSGLIDDQVSQRTILKDYQPSVMYEHTFFDMSILDSSSLVQADSQATYFLARQCNHITCLNFFLSIQKSEQVSVCEGESYYLIIRDCKGRAAKAIFRDSHFITELYIKITIYKQVYQKIWLPGYTMYGMCINNFQLDYLIGVEDMTGDIHIIRFKFTNDTDDPRLQMAIVKDYKVVDKDANLRLSGDLYIDCKFDGIYKGVSTYSIGILGTYFHPNAISSYYYAKFSTKYNLTEYYIKSEDDQTMEVPRKIYMDTENQRVYLAIEINKNKYHERTVYSPGAQPGLDNSNVAIICYQWTHGVREWITLVGSEVYSDVFVDLEQYSNNVYVVVNAVTPQYSTNSSQTDIFYYKMRSENGVISFQEIFGSAGDDKVLDLAISFNGIYMYAHINGPFNPHRDNDKQWKTLGNGTNLALIQLDFDDLILDIEAMDFQNPRSLDYINPYPMKFFLIRSTDVQQNFIMVTHRTNEAVDRKGGIYITYYDNPSNLFMQFTGCPGIGCAKCSGKRPAKCLECMPRYELFQHGCNEGFCPDFTYNVKDAKWKSQKFCKSCHYSCKTCNGPQQDQCKTCCINGACGQTFNRVPSLGKCLCPEQMAEVNGICNFKCVMNLGARLDQKCMTTCPSNSYPMLRYDGIVAQESTQFDPAGENACEKYSYNLQFSKTSMGLPLPGPQDFKSMPDQFTVAFWVLPKELNSKSFFINFFNRGYIWSETANMRVFYKFMTGPNENTDFVQPAYDTPSDSNKISLNQWTYISISQRQIKTATSLYYQMQLSIVKGNFGLAQSVGKAAATENIAVVRYSLFKNLIYIGAQNDLSTDTSFAGAMKEVQIYTSYRGLEQIKQSFSRTQRLYSYDDSQLIAYWKLTETYTQSDPEYTINDYSYNMNSVSYSRLAKPSYPVFVYDPGNTINLCYIHDVRNCLTLDYSGMPPVATSARSYIRLPTLDLREFTRTQNNLKKADDDMIFYVPQNVDCSRRDLVLAKMNYTYDKSKWEVKDDRYNPMYLKEGIHYQQCYYIAQDEIVFNIAQVYVAYRPRTVDPSNGNIYNRSDNTIQFMTGFGDQAFGDVLRLARECDNPQGGETEFVRSNFPSYDRVDVTTSFNLSGTFYFCWYPMFTQNYLRYPIYESIHNLYWKIQYEPVIKSTFRTEARVNQDMVILQMDGTFIDGDLITMAWRGKSYADCNPSNFMGETYMYNHSSWPALWIGHDTGINGITDTNMDDMQICWKPGAEYAPSVYIRIKKEDFTMYQMRIFGYLDLKNQRAPELISFDPPYGSSIILETDRIIKFNFKAQSVVPCKSAGGVLGQIRIYRGAVKKDGTYMKIESNVLWENNRLDENRMPDPFQQGDLICTQTGQCSIILSQESNRMKAGEVYFLTFYSYSFMTTFNNVKYYLFQDGFSVATPAYDHFFMCRSFNVFPSEQLINGRVVIVKGVDLRQKTIKAKYSAGVIDQEIFYTKAINLRLKVYNTDQYQCTFDRPTATVAMEDVYDDYFVIRNLELRQCNSGQLFADVEFLRGIRDDNADYSYLKAEKIYNIQLGSIGCHPSCKVCNGTLETNCMICTNPTYKLFMGKCYPECPLVAEEKDSYQIVYHNVEMKQVICTAICPFGKYSEQGTHTCLQCNQDCQTCNSSIIASCLTCNPIKYLYNGMCVTDCPSPHHENNFTDYLCHVKSKPKFLQVKILSLGFINRIPKDKTVYLKADINNTGGGNITSILWQQMEPTESDKQVLSRDADLTHNSSYQLVRLNNNILMKVGYRETVKVNVTVTNTAGDIAYDIYEFFVNDSPFVNDMDVAVANAPSITQSFKAIDHLIRVNLTKWYDSSDDKEQKLQMKIHLIKSEKIGNTIQTQQFTVTDLVGGTNILYFRIPPIYIDMREYNLIKKSGAQAPDISLVNITYCVSAIDTFNAISSKCANLQNVGNKISFLQDYSKMVDYLLTLNFTNNVTNILFGSNVILQTLQPPSRQNYQPQICTSDVHCNFNGICSSNYGISKCLCNLGYFGTYCDFHGKELPNLQKISQNIIDSTLQLMRPPHYIVQFDVEVMANVVRGLTNHPDLINDLYYFNIIELLQLISDGDVYAHQPYDTNVTNIIMEAYNNAQLKIAHSYKIRRGMKDFYLLGQGMNLFFFKNSFTLSYNKTGINFDNSDAIYFNSDAKKTTSLIGGVGQNKTLRQYLSVNETDLYKNFSRAWEKAFNKYCSRVLYKLQPNNPSFTFRGTAFEIQLLHRVPQAVRGTMFIKSKDSYWNFPPDMFDQSPGVASSKHEIKFKLMKHLLHPFQFEPQPGAFIESNVTTIEFYSLDTKKIPIVLSPTSPNYIQYREPFNTTRGISKEWLRCMLWDPDQYKFVNDGTCGFQFLWEQIPCSDCDRFNQMNTTISLCRCKEMKSAVAVVYFEVNSTIYADGYRNSIYTDFFAMAYWQSSFGFIATLGGGFLFIAGHILIWLLDGRLQRNLVIRLREKARNFELKYSAAMIRDDGIFIKIEKTKKGVDGKKLGSSTVASTKKVFKEVEDDATKNKEELKEGELSPEGNLLRQASLAKKKAAELKKRKKVMGMKKKLFEDDEEDSSSDDEELVKAMKMGDNDAENDEEIRKKMEQMRKEKEDKKALEEALDQISSSSEEEKDLSLLNKKQKAQYLRHQEVLKALKNQKYPHYLYHELLQVQLEQVEGMTQTEFRKKVMSYVRKLPNIYQDQVRDYLTEIKGQLYSTDEELFRSMKDVFKERKKDRNSQLFRLKYLIINGSLILSLINVTSILSPRHIRWTLFMCTVVMLWFICAVFFNNTKDPLVVPDFNTEASSLAFSDLWIAFISPFGSMIMMAVISCFLKMPNSQFVNNVTLRQLEVAVIEYKQEQKFRFLLGYVVVLAIMGYIFLNVITFTATFGWKVSWVWYYTCMASMVMQFVILDPIIACLHWFVYHKCSKKLGKNCQKCRSMGQGYNEAYDLSEGEEERRRKAEIEEKMKARDEKRAAVKAELKKKKTGATEGGLFGEAIGPEEDNDAMLKPQVVSNDQDSEPATKGGKSSGHETADDALNGGSSENIIQPASSVKSKASKKGKRRVKAKQE